MEGCRVEFLAADGMDPHAAAWADLAGRCLEPSVFNEPAFALAAARLIPARRKPRFILVWNGASRLIGLCCFVSGPPGFPAAAWMHAQTTAAFPLLDREDAARALAAILSAIAARAPALLLQGLPATSDTATLLQCDPRWRCVPIERRSRAILRHAEPPPPALPRGDKEIRRQARRLADIGAVSTTSARSPGEVEAAVGRFLALEAQGWKGRQGTALSQSSAHEAFVRHMTRDLAQSGQCRIDCLTLDGEAAAAGIVLRSGTRAFYWKTAYDEALRRLSPGVQLALSITITQLAEPGLELTDSCAVPNHAMIDRLWPDRMDVVDLLCSPVRASRWRFAAALRLESTRRSVRRSLKRLYALQHGLRGRRAR